MFEQALELPVPEVSAFLDRECGDDADLRQAVDELLAADRAAGDFLEAPAALPATEAPPFDPSAGRQMGPYRLLRRIGAGGMGEVYLARDTRLHRNVAVKLLPAEWSHDSAAQERFTLEARTASALDHPNICTIHDIGVSDEGRFFLVMAYYRGETLERRLARGPLPVAQAVDIAAQIGRGLALAHEAGVVHRDIKPANVMVTLRGEVKLLDFGIARLVGALGLTRTGALVGTPAYLSPEQARGETVDARTDLWALGVVLYEMLSGRRPFAGEHPQAVIHAILTRDPAPLCDEATGVPAALERIVFRALAKTPAERYPSAVDLLRDLQSGQPAGAVVPALDPHDAHAPTAEPVLRVLAATVPAGGARSWSGDGHAVALAARHDRMARDLLARFGGLEVDKQDGFLHLFERAADAVGYALAYHQALARLSQEADVELAAGVSLHLGEVLLRRNPPADVARGARPLEVEGEARSTVARLASLAAGRQTLLTRAVFDLARRSAVDDTLGAARLHWLAHGAYVFTGVPEPLEVFEVGVEGFAPLAEPPGSAVSRRQVAVDDEPTLGWRPAPGQPIPRRPNWVLEARLGEGGFGEVWLARHKSGDRRVFKFCFEAVRLRALKREVTLFRLLKEALGHRHDIAGLLDWNLDHAPYFLEAEYTEGGDLPAWAAAQGGLERVPLATRLELMAEVAEALAAAHSVGVLHKDVKPQNVLIATDREGRPRARLTDFGIGLLTEEGKRGMQALTAASVMTAPESGGTARYMAPELLEGKPATIQADVYSLGVMLYQMVAGDLSRALAPGWRRDVEDELLAEDVAGFVDGRPERRPGSAAEVAERLRSLETRRAAQQEERRAREAAEAARTALERAQRRRKLATAVAAAALVVLAVVAALAVRERQARRTADLRQQQAEDLIGFMLGDLRQKLEPVGRLEILDGVGAKALQYFAAVPESELSDAELARRSQALYQIGDVRTRQGRVNEAIKPLEESLRLAQALARRDPDDARRLFDLGQSHFWLGSARREQGDLDRALEQFQAYFDIASRLVRRDPANREWTLELAYAYTNLGAVQETQGKLDKAAASVRRAMEIKQGLAAGRPDDAALQESVANGLSWLARVLEKQGDLRGALTEYERERALRARLAAARSDDTQARFLLAVNESHLAEMRLALGEPQAALTELAGMHRTLAELTALDPDNGDWRRTLAACHLQVGEARLDLGEADAAQAAFVAARRLTEGLSTTDSAKADWRRDAGRIEVDLAAVALARGDAAAARRAAETGLAALAPLLAERPDDRTTRSLLAQAYLLLGRSEQALGDGRRAQEAWRRAYQTVAPAVRASADPVLLDPWARAALHLGRSGEAVAVAERLRAAGYARAEFLATFERKGDGHGAEHGAR